MVVKTRFQSVSQTVHEFRQANPEGAGDDFDVAKGQIPFTSFDTSDVGSIQATFGSEAFLRQAFRLPQLSDLSPETCQNVVCFADLQSVSNRRLSVHGL